MKKRRTEYYRDWYKNNGRSRSSAEKDSGNRWRDDNKEKTRAIRRLNYLVQLGKVKKPSNCQICGIQAVLCGHHHDYSKPEDVIWLCYSCHKLVHREIIGNNT